MASSQSIVPVNGGSRHPLTEKQRAFFLRQKQTVLETEMAMRGALQLIVEEQELPGKATLSADCSELILEESP